MNGRMYDPALSRVLSVDNYIQAPEFSQSFNRYAYCMNNPLKYTDSDGEWIIAAMVAGAFINAITQDMSGNINSFGDFAEAIAIGALSGAAGYGAGAAVAGAVGTIGFVGGAMTGAAGGFASGFVTGAGNAWAQGVSFGKGLGQGVIPGGFGAAIGGLTGGVSGFVKATKMGFDPWTGTGIGKPIDMNASTALPGDKGELTGITGSQQLTDHTHANYPGSEEYVQGAYIGLEGKNANPFNAAGYTVKDGQLYNRSGAPVHGATRAYRNKFFERFKSFIPVSPNMVTHANNLHAVLGHELIHAYHHFNGFMGRFGDEASEYLALKFSASVPHSTQFGASVLHRSMNYGLPYKFNDYLYPSWVKF